MKRLVFIFFVSILCLSANLCPPLPDPVPRDTSEEYSGSAKWAYDLALPHIPELLPADVVFYYITGSMVSTQGRLAANRGSWTFRYWSESQGKSVGVQVKYDGEVGRSVLITDIDPSDRHSPIPEGWLNSTEIYEIACPSCGSRGFGAASLNYADPSYGNGQPVWILFNLDNKLVRWDGVVIDNP